MNKSELIEAIADSADISKAAAGRALNATLEAIIDALKKDAKQKNAKKREGVTLIGFGTFSVRERAARKGRNPKTGDEIDIPATNVPSFKAGKALKDAVN